MTNKYPPEFDEIYRKVILERKRTFEDVVVTDYFDMLTRENWTLLRTFHCFEKYVKEKQANEHRDLEKKIICD